MTGIALRIGASLPDGLRRAVAESGRRLEPWQERRLRGRT